CAGPGSDAEGPETVLSPDNAGAPRSAAAVLSQGSADGQAAGPGHARSRQGDAGAPDAGYRAQQHRQRARLQATPRAELPVLPAVGQPRHQLGAVEPGLDRSRAPQPDPVLVRIAAAVAGPRQAHAQSDAGDADPAADHA